MTDVGSAIHQSAPISEESVAVIRRLALHSASSGVTGSQAAQSGELVGRSQRIQQRGKHAHSCGIKSSVFVSGWSVELHWMHHHFPVKADQKSTCAISVPSYLSLDLQTNHLRALWVVHGVSGIGKRGVRSDGEVLQGIGGGPKEVQVFLRADVSDVVLRASCDGVRIESVEWGNKSDRPLSGRVMNGS